MKKYYILKRASSKLIGEYLCEFSPSKIEKLEKHINVYKPLFLKEAGNNGYEIPIASANTETSCNTRVEKSYEVTDEEKLIIKKVFRDIAKICHPDKTENLYKKKLYNEAQIAYEKNDFITLCKIAKKINLTLDIDINQSILLKKSIEEKEKEIESVSKSFLWLWVHSTTKEEKDEIMKQFINQSTQK
jgi:hypothetical protein